MKKRRLIIIIAAAILIGTTVFLISDCRQRSIFTTQPITFEYVKTGQFNNSNSIVKGSIFWATNHTSKTLAISMSAIEVKDGSNWATISMLNGPVWFQISGTSNKRLFLNPHEANYAEVMRFNEPTNKPWRMRVFVYEKLNGIERLKHYPMLVKRRASTGDTNISLNPFSTNIPIFGQPAEVESETVTEEE